MKVTNILVLKLGALGNIVLSLAAFAAIRQHHPDGRITLLTTAPYAGWMADAPWFDRVLTDTRPAWWDLRGVRRLRRMLRDGHFDRVYDLQTSSRSSHYFRLFPRASRPEWSGIAPGCSHPDRDPERNHIHDIDRQHGQLRQAGIADIPPADLSWCRGDIARFALPRRFALLVPGSAPHRPVKRWPAAHYRVLADWLIRQGIAPVVVGTAGEHVLADAICAGASHAGTTHAGATHAGEIHAGTTHAGATHTGAIHDGAIHAGATYTGAIHAGTTRAATTHAGATHAGAINAGTTHAATTHAGATHAGAIHAGAIQAGSLMDVGGTIAQGTGTTIEGAFARDLTGRTSFGDLAELGRAATLAVGNDTGPMHLLAAAGCPSLVLFSGDSDPALCVPRAPPGALPVRVLRRDDLATLTPDEVIADLVAAHAPDAATLASQKDTQQIQASHEDTQPIQPAPPASARATA